MLIETVIPLADCRSFVEYGPPRLLKPTWPLPGTDEFVRSCGPIKRRRKGGHPYWLDELNYCNAKQAIKLPVLSDCRLGAQPFLGNLKCVFRRLLCDGSAVVRIELGFSGVPSAFPRRGLASGVFRCHIQDEEYMPIIRDFLDLKASIPGASDHGKVSTLLGLGKAIADLYARETTPNVATKYLSQAVQLVRPGNSMLLIETNGPDDSIPKNMIHIKPITQKGVSLWFQWFTHHGRETALWFLRSEDKQLSRQIRLGLVRMHCEHQTLKLVLRSLLDGRIAYEKPCPAGDCLDKYLISTVRLFAKSRRKDPLLKDIHDIITAHELVHRDDRQLLSHTLKHARRQIRVQLQEYISCYTVDAKTSKWNNASKQNRLCLSSPKRFDVALSFPGEHRERVSDIADKLTHILGKDRVFYDRYYEAELARPNLDTYLQKIYHDDSELIVVFLCAQYRNKQWCGLEWRAIRDLLKQRRSADIMLMRFDATRIPGLFSIDGYIDIKERNVTDIIKLIIQRLEHNRSDYILE